MGLVSRPLTSDQDSTSGFFGDSSTIAFIKQLQDTVKSRTPKPPQEPSHQDFRQYVNQESPRALVDATDSRDLLPPRHLADHLVDCYFTKIHSLYPFVHKVARFSPRINHCGVKTDFPPVYDQPVDWVSGIPVKLARPFTMD